MTNQKRILIAITGTACLVGYLFLTRKGRNNEIDADVLLRRQRQIDSAAEDDRLAQATDLDLLRKSGRGQPVPAHLVSEIDPSFDHWVVADRKLTHRAEVPFQPGQLPTPPSTDAPVHTNPGFLGADACKECHARQYDSFVETAHYRTSRHADPDDIIGSFQPGQNELNTGTVGVSFQMIERDGVPLQRTSFFGWQFDVPIHLTFGSSNIAETYAYWSGDKLYQLNCSCLGDGNRWINSPGYVDGDAAFARPILPGCIDCHSTYIDVREMPNRYTPQSLIVGISCERCHRPGKQHVQYHQANPDAKQARHISVPSKLTRQQQMDVCGQCHTSNKQLGNRRPFQFRPGDRLEDHYTMLDESQTDNQVHASNQSARLAMSRCFQASDMACVECHNPHHNERGQVQLFSERCLSCHETQHCTFPNPTGLNLGDNCIDCHMPKGSGNLHINTEQGKIFPPLRDHYIRVDAAATQDFLRSQQSP
ncbi:hypothetical protein Mal15_34840 [Stieleria maiorica]|uniref:Cytochrome c-552/4 domain-containing protein n=1 Tax=Stieleria maiorica TaxID=2795974 RepID=A0A5B9MHF1_9BACT|nr:multiheme c-type cytochrome [Stieleria maiorica]QEF99420.1 hypothetical protein Mal15_34840 [Stieleria maiorica]